MPTIRKNVYAIGFARWAICWARRSSSRKARRFFDLEEEIRGLAKAWRSGDRLAQRRITDMVSLLVEDIAAALAVLKAFSTYFQLVNLAEEAPARPYSAPPCR